MFKQFAKKKFKTCLAFVAAFSGFALAVFAPAYFSSAAGTTPPAVSIAAPKNHESVYGIVAISAAVADAAGVVRVDFYYQGTSSGSMVTPIGKASTADSNGDYSISWNASAVPSGSYNIIAKATDVAGNTGASSPTTVFVNQAGPANTPPVITLLGSNPMTVVTGTAFTDPGAIASDAKDGVLTPLIKKTGTVNTARAGTYLITYTVSNKEGAQASIVRTVKVIGKAQAINTPPVITLLGPNPLIITEGTSFTDPGATASDREDGALTGSIVTEGAVDTLTPGTYTVAYTATDYGTPPLSTTVIRTVNVVPACTTLGGCRKNIGMVSETAIGRIKDIASSPQADVISKSIAITGLVIGAAGSVAAVIFATPFSLSELILLPLRLWSLLLLAFGIKKRARPWGTVYDSVTKRPLDPVILELVDKNGAVVASAITDLDGRYGFLAPAGHYMIRARKTNYAFPSLLLGHVTRDEIYLDLYFGNYFEIKKEGEVITKNIPMDPDTFSWNEFQKKEETLTHFYSSRTVLITRLTDILFSVGFATAIIAFIAAPRSYNIAIFSLYIVMLVMKEAGPSLSKLGTVRDKETGRPLPYAIIRVYSATLGNEVLHKISTKYGNFYCLVPNGDYILTVEKKNPDGSYSKIFNSDTIKVQNGIIKGVWNV